MALPSGAVSWQGRVTGPQHLRSQVVVCKIRRPPLFVPQALLSAISFHLPRVVLTIFLPIVRVVSRHFRGLSKQGEITVDIPLLLGLRLPQAQLSRGAANGKK
jgi:hypothetical protein